MRGIATPALSQHADRGSPDGACRARFIAAFCLLASAAPGSLVGAAPTPGRLPQARPEAAGMSAEALGEIQKVAAQGIAEGQMPGCVVLIARRGKVVYLKAFGHRQLEPEPVPMTTDTVFDLASLTKPVATATSVMILADQGKVCLEAPVCRYVPEFGSNGKESITLVHLLTHQGGLVPDNPLKDYQDGPAKAWERIFALDLRAEPGSKFIYTDVGFLVLGEVIRRVSGRNVHEFSREHIFRPLGMTETGYLPGPALRRRAAPTEKREGRWMRGEVHDPRAYLLGGVAGHAGLFSTAEDLAVYAQMMIGGGQYRGVRILSRRAVQRMTSPHRVSSGRRGLGWDMRTGYSSNRGRSFSDRAFGHGGFTGTAMWIDPELELVVIFLSNRLHPDGKGTVNPLAGRIGTIAADAIRDRPTPRREKGADHPPRSKRPTVLTGIDVLQRDGFRALAGGRVGLITNHTGVNRQGIGTPKLLHEAENVQLVALFSPEHGLHGKLDTASIADGRDPRTGLPVFSLYGKTRQPTAAMLEGIDTLVFDIQDIGTRFYTYISTMGLAMEAAAREGKRFVVLDRPNPINGVDVEGPVLDRGRESFVGFHPIAVRHGMTVGELARMFRSERKLDLELEIIPLEGWKRTDFFEDTGLRWINPSPNMRSPTEALLYPGIGLLETTNLSVGRGTATPFELIGAPWLDGRRLEQALGAARLPGIHFRAVEFTPTASKFAGELCRGVSFRITDRRAFRPLRTGLEIARQLHLLWPEIWNVRAYDRLLADRNVLRSLLDGKTVAEIQAVYRHELETFKARRARFLLY
ncbi:MAG TPA: DUF1343 domain-containing protein [Planctomycetaceae bacterium]|nr:DUF1343 domain-containing protein [Planctomycetaceae bacterium]